MAYRVRIFCRDCLGNDETGCFDGGTELLAGVFSTVDQAGDRGMRAAAEGEGWAWEVIDDHGNVVSTEQQRW
jgi:hypothetical protein